MLPGHFLVTLPALSLLGVSGETLRSFATLSYAAVFAWGIIDNDYTRLHEIGLDTSRRPLRRPQPSPKQP